ncbi:MAG: hypothetical protein ABIY51_09260 [Ferruginibacter sp.]
MIMVLVAFLPVSSFLFFLKNDAFAGYFPPKFFMSESLHNGTLPLWNPYINFGIPQYGDMSSGFWSPITWLISSTVGYTPYSFTIEVLLYLFIAGTGMYILCRQSSFNKIVCLIAGASFMCSGYMIGHMQHFNWISGAAFLPWCLWSYKKIIQDFSAKNVIEASLVFYLLISSAHPGITIGAFYFFAAYAIFDLFSGKQKTVSQKIPGFLKTNLAFIVGLLVLCTGLIMGYADILPHFSRAEKPVMEAVVNPTNFKTWISFLFPMSITKNENWFATDVSMRNLYMGISLLLFFVFALLSKKTREQLFFLFVGLFFLLIAAGGRLTQLLYQLPLLGYVRLPGEYSVFALFAFILVGAFSLNNFIQNESHRARLALLTRSFFVLIAAASSWAFIKILTSHDSLVYKSSLVNSTGPIAGKMKLIIDNISFYDALFLQGIIQLIMLAFIAQATSKKNFKKLLYIVVADLIIATLLNLPFTAVGQSSVKNVQQVLLTSPRGIILPLLQPITSNDTGTISKTSLVGNWSFYNKQPGVTKEVAYPIKLNTTKNIFSASNKENFSKALIFSVSEKSIVTIKKFTGKQIIVATNSETADTIVLQQNFYPHWKIFIDNHPAPLIAYKGIYLASLVPAGNHTIDFIFQPNKIKAAMLFSALLWISALIYLLFKWISPSLQRKQPGP